MIRYFASHPTAANLLMVALIALGLAAMPEVKRETFPDIPPEDVEVRVPYPGASAEEVEEAICQRIEDVVDSVDDINETRCDAREGMAIATLEMREGSDFDRFLEDIKTEVEAIDTFPEDAEIPVIRQLGRTDFVASVAIAGPMSAPHLKAYAEQVKDRLLMIPGISKVDVQGFSDHQIRIEVPANTLRQFGLSVQDLADIVARQSIDLPSGIIETTDSDVLIRFTDERRTPREFENLVVVTAASGAEIRLGDIATITDRFELDEDKTLFNGQRAAYLSVEKGKADDTLTVVDAMGEFLEAERAGAAPGMTLELTRNLSSIVRDRLSLLLRNGAWGLGLVFLTMWLFFSFRFSFWVAMGLPVSFLGTIAMMALLGYSFDMITMVGLLIAVGLIMDDAIVLSENIAAHLRRGAEPLTAAIEGARQVAPGVIASYLTTICIFGALAFLEGHMGAVLKVLPVILLTTLSVSLVEAFLILPHHLAHALKGAGEKKPSALRRRFDGAIDWLRDVVIGSVVDWAVRWRYLAAGLVIAMLIVAASAIAGGVLKFRAFPDLEGDVIEARILLPQGTPLKRTEAVVARVTEALKQVGTEFAQRQPERPPLIRNLAIQYNRNSDSFESGPHVATVIVDLLGFKLRDHSLDKILGRWRTLVGKVPDVISIKFVEPQIGPGGRALDIRLLGSDLGELKEASLELQSWLNSYKGVLDLSDDLRPGKPEVRVRLREGAMVLGISARDIAAQMRTAFRGKVADEIQVGPESFEIDVRLSGVDRDSLADLDYFTVTATDGVQVPLNAVAVLESGRGFSRINRIDGQRAVTIQGDIDTTVANANAIVQDTRKRFLPALAKRHPGVRAGFEGQAKESAKTGSSLQRNFLIGILGVFLLLSFQFKSYIEPVVVMIAIPMGLIGVVGGHLMMGLELSMPSMVGFASLAGVVVNDSILLVEFIKIRRRAGEVVTDAARLAARQRFRAILLTSLTTLAGLLPLLTETSLQAQVLIPLVTSLAFGLTVATMLVLVVVPVSYAILDDFGLTAPLGQAENPGTGNTVESAAP